MNTLLPQHLIKNLNSVQVHHPQLSACFECLFRGCLFRASLFPEKLAGNKHLWEEYHAIEPGFDMISEVKTGPCTVTKTIDEIKNKKYGHYPVTNQPKDK